MKSRWKIFVTHSRRIYDILFETRSIDIIRSDFYNNLWISKEELLRLHEQEKIELLEEIAKKTAEYTDLLSSFSLNALSNYELSERKYQGKLKKLQ